MKFPSALSHLCGGEGQGLRTTNGWRSVGLQGVGVNSLPTVWVLGMNSGPSAAELSQCPFSNDRSAQTSLSHATNSPGTGRPQLLKWKPSASLSHARSPSVECSKPSHDLVSFLSPHLSIKSSFSWDLSFSRQAKSFPFHGFPE